VTSRLRQRDYEPTRKPPSMRWTSRTPLLRWANAKVAWGGPLTGGHTRPRTATGGTPSDLSPINKYQELQRRPLTKPQIVPFWAAVSPGL